MTDSLKRRPLVAVSFVAAVLLAVGALTFAGPCIHEDGSAAVCHTAAHAIAACGVVGAVGSLAALFLRGDKAAAAAAVVSAAAGIFAAVAPGTVFGLCMMQTMRCWTVMKPFALVCGGVLFVCALIAAIALLRKGRGRAA